MTVGIVSKSLMLAILISDKVALGLVVLSFLRYELESMVLPDNAASEYILGIVYPLIDRTDVVFLN